jgi:hypothetical protein
MAKDRSCFRMKDVREAALGAHAAARETQDGAARAAARSVGHAVATAHVTAHARGAVIYATKAITESGSLVDLKRIRRLHRLPPTFSSGRLPALVDGKTEVEEEARELGMSVTRLEGL